MKISTKGRYALRVMIDLALHNNGDYLSLKDIAERQNISSKYLEQIIPLLLKGGFIESTRGKMGGYKLSKKPDECKIGDILRATEGDLSPLECLVDGSVCIRQKSCKTHKFWKGLDDVINEYVDSKTLQDLINN